MKVAILISGYLRSFSDNFDVFKSTILDRFDDLDIYLHFTKNGDKEDKYLNFNKDLDEIGKILNPKCLLCEENMPITGNKSIDNTLKMRCITPLVSCKHLAFLELIPHSTY